MLDTIWFAWCGHKTLCLWCLKSDKSVCLGQTLMHLVAALVTVISLFFSVINALKRLALIYWQTTWKVDYTLLSDDFNCHIPFGVWNKKVPNVPLRRFFFEKDKVYLTRHKTSYWVDLTHWGKIYISTKKVQFENLNFYNIHTLKITFFDKNRVF